ncbi:hypothetical protein [Aquimarina sp. 2201CG14-23]|uniref:hypothetical protein n=1 Tax=Aquimarina mycalae TaxID=3040073 RepID=UPI0024780A22|nr:hypothetical protein [Aquimarina sp. 2201CG14-23]MDH7447649.1 hypothetical protein [Aquimarina sp. 2201CG14-23]
MSEETTSIGKKIEDSLQNFLLFFFKYIKSIYFIFRNPHKLYTQYEKEVQNNFKTFVYPLTFLTFSYFLIAIVINFYFQVTNGSNRLYIDVIFITTELIQEVYNEVNEAPSILEIFLTTLPGITSIYLLVYLFSLNFKKELRKPIIDLLFYSIGLQCFIFFMCVVIVFFMDKELFFFHKIRNSFISSIFYFGLIIYSLFHPFIVINSLSKPNTLNTVSKRLYIKFLGLVLVVIVPLFYFWSGALVPLIKSSFKEKKELVEEDISIDLGEHYIIKSDSINSMIFTLMIENNTDEVIFIDSSEYEINLSQANDIDLDDDSDEIIELQCDSITYKIKDRVIFDSLDREVSVFVLPAKSITYWKLKGQFPNLKVDWDEDFDVSENYCCHLEFGYYDNTFEIYFSDYSKQN